MKIKRTRYNFDEYLRQGERNKVEKAKVWKLFNDTVKLKVDTVNDTVNHYRIINVYYRVISYQKALLKSSLQYKTENCD
ncbi:MAG TPA: hypothetical protein DCM02_11215 [Flavobacterium sp.]|nr:hypothetical protein [Flavobacterium sp.]HAT75945.1 hypothetical protein [Flavobacterium sp.]